VRVGIVRHLTSALAVRVPDSPRRTRRRAKRADKLPGKVLSVASGANRFVSFVSFVVNVCGFAAPTIVEVFANAILIEIKPPAG
jgi:hypothetical protein